MDGTRNILQAINDGDFDHFLQILDEGFRSAARSASEESHFLDLEVADGRAQEAPETEPEEFE